MMIEATHYARSSGSLSVHWLILSTDQHIIDQKWQLKTYILQNTSVKVIMSKYFLHGILSTYLWLHRRSDLQWHTLLPDLSF